ncbi:MAG: DEAD/DEAH box helicase [Gemmatimonadota bacterium]|nr:DEAD/DEAH box helicase [Gemmatimonadota bacterium]
MRIGGLFIGVSAQSDSEIPALKFAARDALALWSAFADANEAAHYFGDDTQLLLNGQATRDEVLQAIDALVERSRERDYGFVMIHFSGHGTPDGRLVVYDTDHSDIAGTSLPLNEITERVGQIRASNIILTFDSCFAATVVGLEGSDNAAGFDSAMKKLAGESRTVAWAAKPTEKALESPTFAHGFFSKGLLVGLDDAAIRDGNNIVLTHWIQNAMSFVQKQATAIGRIQTPGGRIHLSANASIPIVPKGDRQRRLAEEDGILSVGSDSNEIARYELFDTATLDAIRTRLGGDMHQLQVDAISIGGVLAGRHVLVKAPTSAGKTFIGELAVLRACAQRRKAVILLPMRAMVHEQWEAFEKHYGQLGLRVVRSCGDTDDDDDLIRGQHFDVAFLTYEKFAAQVFARPGLLDALGAVVLDEIQLISDKSRGRTVELILARMLRRRSKGHKIQLVGLCADVGDLNHLPEWLGATAVFERVRPVPLYEGVLFPSGEFRYRESPGDGPKTIQIPAFPVDTHDVDKWGYEANVRTRMATVLIRHLALLGQTVLAFRSTRKLVRQLAAALRGTISHEACQSTIDHLSSPAVGAEVSRASQQLHWCLNGGVAFHISDLDRREREALESAFRTGKVSVMVATTGLAMGLNTPARAVVVGDHTLWGGESKGDVPFSVTDYRNMAGRAGRLLGDRSPGWSYLVANTEAEGNQLWADYIESPGDTLTSGLAALSPEDLALALLAIIGKGYLQDLVQIALATFHGFNHRNDKDWRLSTRASLDRATETLEAAGFVKKNSDNTFELTAAGRVCGWEGLRFASAARLVALIDDVVTSGEEFDDGTLVALAQCTDELDEIRTPMGKTEPMEWTTKPPKFFDAHHQAALRGLKGADGDVVSAFFPQRMKRWSGLAMWAQGTNSVDIESRYDRRADEPAMGPLRRVAERTADVLRGVCALASLRKPDVSELLTKQCALLAARLEHGVTKEASELTRLGLRITRKESMELAKMKILDGPALFAALNADDKRVFGLFGSDRAHQLKSIVLKRGGKGAGRYRAPSPLPDFFDEATDF